jgi:hypothetical protein
MRGTRFSTDVEDLDAPCKLVNSRHGGGIRLSRRGLLNHVERPFGTVGGVAVELAFGLVVIGMAIWGLTKLADHFEERNFLFWLVFYLAGGALCIMLLAGARAAAN